MKKFLLKCLLLGLCIGAVYSSVNTYELVSHDELQPGPKSSTSNTGKDA